MADETKPAKVRRYWRLRDKSSDALYRFDTFDEAMNRLAQEPGEWCAWFTLETIGKGDCQVEPAWEETTCANPPSEPSKPPPSGSNETVTS